MCVERLACCVRNGESCWGTEDLRAAFQESYSGGKRTGSPARDDVIVGSQETKLSARHQHRHPRSEMGRPVRTESSLLPNRLVALVPGYGSISGRCRLVAFLALVGDPEGNPVVEQTAPASGLPVNRTSSPGASLLTWTAGVPANSPGPEERTVKSMRLRCTRGNIVHCVAASTLAAVGSAPC